MYVAGREFVLVGALGPDLGSDGSPLEFVRQAAYARAATTRLNPHGAGPFCRLRIAAGRREAGV